MRRYPNEAILSVLRAELEGQVDQCPQCSCVIYPENVIDLHALADAVEKALEEEALPDPSTCEHDWDVYDSDRVKGKVCRKCGAMNALDDGGMLFVSDSSPQATTSWTVEGDGAMGFASASHDLRDAVSRKPKRAD